MKKFLKFILSGVLFCILLFVGVIGYAYIRTSDARALGDEFVSHIHAHELDKAYAMLHKNLQEKLARADFDKLITDGHVDTVESVKWSTWEVGEGLHTVSGTTPDGNTTALVQTTELENDGKNGILKFNFAPAKKE